ncbi:MAG: response regulator transcription factor [Chthoniobacteraceae bacterium]
MRLLLVEDDPKITQFVTKGLTQAGYSVDHASDGENGLHLALTEKYDTAIIDVMLPKRDGLSIISEMQRANVRTPVLTLSAKRSVEDRVIGLQAGSDDYLTKPFAFSELLARVQALIRRKSEQGEPTKLTAGDLSMDLVKRRVERGAQPIELPAP